MTTELDYVNQGNYRPIDNICKIMEKVVNERKVDKLCGK